MVRYVLSFLLCSLFLLEGCSFISPLQEVSVRSPSVPEELGPLYRGVWTLECCSLSGDSRIRELDWKDGIPDSFSLTRSKEQDLLVLLRPPSPVLGQGFFPAGVWIPWDREAGSASFHNGAAVFLTASLAKGGFSMREFNMDRFLEEMGELENPWNCDRELLLRQLGRHQMCSWYIHERRGLPVGLTLPAGRWYQANPETAPLSSDGSPREFDLAEGYHFFYCPAREQAAEVQVDDHGEAVMMLSTGGEDAREIRMEYPAASTPRVSVP